MLTADAGTRTSKARSAASVPAEREGATETSPKSAFFTISANAVRAAGSALARRTAIRSSAIRVTVPVPPSADPRSRSKVPITSSTRLPDCRDESIS